MISKRWNGKVRVTTGIRCCGKSFLLSTLCKDYLRKEGVSEDCSIEIALDRKASMKYRNPNALYEHIMGKACDGEKRHYVFIDEIQLSIKVKNTVIDEGLVLEDDKDMFYTMLYGIPNDLMARKNLDIYVTGSNSKMLSSDIVTNFRDRRSEIKVYPLSFKEYYEVCGLERADTLEKYLTYGRMPSATLEQSGSEKQKYLYNLHENVYIKDIVERYNLKDDEMLDALIDSLYSAVGSLTNTYNLANTASSFTKRKTSDHTIKNYINYPEDTYLFLGAKRYDIKGKKHFDNTQKYYSIDMGLRNAKLNFRQQEKSHLMEDLIYLGLIRRGYRVDVGVVELTRVIDGKKRQSQYEIDSIANTGCERIYVQPVLNVDTVEKKNQETSSLKNSGDFFKKMVILDDNFKLWMDGDGITYVGIIPFLLEESIIPQYWHSKLLLNNRERLPSPPKNEEKYGRCLTSAILSSLI